MVADGLELAKIHKNVVVKLPLTRDGIEACSKLSKQGIRTNVTLVFSASQALLAAARRVIERYWRPRLEAMSASS